MNRKATLIVLAWNRWDLTKRCLDTLGETDLTGAEVLVVDNGSEDETPEGLKSYGWLRVLPPGHSRRACLPHGACARSGGRGWSRR